MFKLRAPKSQNRLSKNSSAPRLSVEQLENRRMMAALTSGNGPGTVDLSTSSGYGVDGYGAFGTASGGPATGDATLTLPDNSTFAPTVYQSGIAIGIGTDRYYLTSGATAGSGGLSDPTTTVNGSSSTATSSFTVPNLGGGLSSLDGLDVELSQELALLSGSIGSMLTQTYRITNNTGAGVAFDIFRYADPDLMQLTEGGGRRITPGGAEVLFTTDSLSDFGDATTYVAISAEGGVLPSTGRFEVDSYSGLLYAISGGTSLDDAVYGDSDSDGTIDSPYDVTLGLRNAYSLGVGQTAVYITRTVWGTDDLSLGDSIDAAFALAPKVMGVAIGGPNTVDGNRATPDGYYDIPSGDGSQLSTVPVGGANKVSISFSEQVAVASGNLTLNALTGATVPALSSFTAPTALNNYTATWTYAAALPASQYRISLSDDVEDQDGMPLDGEWTNPFSVTTVNAAVSEFPSGDGVSGGYFNFVFTILPGDANLDNVVDGNDWLIYQRSFNVSGLGFVGADYNGDGITNATDHAFWNTNFGDDLTDLIFADFDNNGVVNFADFSILSANYNMPGDFEDGDVNGDGTVNLADFSVLSYQYNWELDWVA